jgi:outer membrane lipoprotein-sorting protein
MAEQVFKNVQVLKGIPVNEFMGTMGVFSAALGMSCEDCHAAGDADWSVYAKDSPRKQMARVMVTMMATINKTHFRGRQVVTCYTCHRGSARPRNTADLAELYGTPPGVDPNGVFEQAPNAPPADQVLDKYIQAIGGAQQAAALKSYVARGTSSGYGPENEPRPVEIYARPGQRTTIIHTSAGDSTTTFDGKGGWIAAPFRPVAVLALSDQDLDGLKLDADLAFPGGIKQTLTKWRVGLPTVIDDREMQVVQGTTARGATGTLYFDMETGLLRRQVRYVDSPVGRLPTQTDYEEYREVAGVKMPVRWTVTWLDGRDVFEIKDVQPNVTIDAARLARPPAPAVKK